MDTIFYILPTHIVCTIHCVLQRQEEKIFPHRSNYSMVGLDIHPDPLSIHFQLCKCFWRFFGLSVHTHAFGWPLLSAGEEISR